MVPCVSEQVCFERLLLRVWYSVGTLACERLSLRLGDAYLMTSVRPGWLKICPHNKYLAPGFV